MKTRYPNFDFAACTPNWVPGNPEVAHMIDAIGIVPAYIEPFLIKVLNRAKTQLDPVADADLIRDIDIFNKQEGQHFKMHRSYMKMLHAGGYEAIQEHERAYEADYDRFLATKSLRWLLAYCEGFEAIGSSTAGVWVDAENAQMFPGAEPLVPELWAWHLAEEYEHRMVAFDLYHRLYGKPKGFAYLYRLFGFFRSNIHLQIYIARVSKTMIEQDRASMTAAELQESKQRQKVATRQSLQQVKKLFRVLSPLYNPANTPKPRHLDAVLAKY